MAEMNDDDSSSIKNDSAENKNTENESDARSLLTGRIGQPGYGRLQTQTDIQQCLQHMLSQARRSIAIQTPNLPALYAEEELLSALSTFIRQYRYAEFRLLIADPTPAISNGHALVTLMQRLSSRMSARALPDDQHDRTHHVVIVDNMATMTLRDHHQNAFVDWKALSGALHKTEQFNELWQRAREIPDFRRLML